MLITEIPDDIYQRGCKLCSVRGKIYLIGGMANDTGTRAMEYNPATNTWRNMPRLLAHRGSKHQVCVLDDKIYVVGGAGTSAEVLDLSDEAPRWRYIAPMNNHHTTGAQVVGMGDILIVQSCGSTEVYDVGQGGFTNTHVAKTPVHAFR